MKRLVALAALAIAGVHGATDIDSGFKQDGTTTYCDGVFKDGGPLVFENLQASSAGKCPLNVKLAVSATTVPTIATQVTVNWSASLISGDVSTTLFPRVLNETSGVPKNVIASLLRACKKGSNCATDSDVVVPAALGASDESVGAFGADGKKNLRSYVFQFPAEGEYVVVGKIVLPGDAQLNISATEFVSFQSVIVGTSIVGTVKPESNTGSEAGAPNFVNAALNPASTPEASSGSRVGVNAQEAKDGGLGGGETTSGNKTNVIVLSSIAAIGAVIALAYFTSARREQARQNGMVPGSGNDVDDASIYRLTDAAKAQASMKMPTNRGQPPMAYSAPMAYPPRPPQQPSSHSQHDSYRSQDSAAYDTNTSSNALPLTRRDLNSIDSNDEFMMHSHTTSFGGLHDSAVALPVIPRNHRASSASSYHDALSESDNDEFDDEFDNKSSRLFTEVSVDPYSRSTELSEFNDTNGFKDSLASWAYSDRDSEMSAMSDLQSMHEKWGK